MELIDNIRANETLKRLDLTKDIVKFMEGERRMDLEPDEIYDVINKELTCYFKGKVKSPSEFEIKLISDKRPSLGLLLITGSNELVGYNDLSPYMAKIINLQGGLPLSVGYKIDRKMKEGELKLIYLAAI